MVITRVGPLSVAKIAGLIYAVIGLIAGALLSLVAMAGFAAGLGRENVMLGPIFGVGAVILVPIFYGCVAFVITLIQAALFNVAVRIVGGIEIEAR